MIVYFLPPSGFKQILLGKVYLKIKLCDSILNMNNKILMAFLIIFLGGLSALSFADPNLDAAEIVKRSDDLMRGDSNQGIYTMTVETPNWKRELKLYVYSLGRDKMFIRILSPDKEKGVGTLRIKNEMWNYLPRVEKTIKIPPSLMLQPWMGSDFANDDLVKESSLVHDYTHQLIDQEERNEEIYYVIELTPKAGAAVIWGKIRRWVNADNFIPLREEYYSDKGDLIKVLEFSDVAQVSDRMIPRTWTMTPFNKSGYSTTIRLVDVQYNQPIDDAIFTLTNLKKIQ